jgi:hypothetical protein
MANRITICAILLLVACGAPPTHVIPPTPQPIAISLLPSLQPLTPALLACAEGLPDIVIFLEEVPADLIYERDSDLILWLGASTETGRFASPLVQEEIVVIINPENPLGSIELNDLRAIFSGRMENWEEIAGVDSQISVWIYPQGNEIQDHYSDVIMDGNTSSSLARLAPDADAMLEAVSTDPAAIGVIPKAWLNDSVKQLSLSGFSLLQPILVLSRGEPQGNARALVACLQNQVGMELLLGKYSPWE